MIKVIPKDGSFAAARAARNLEKALNGFFETRPIDVLMMFGVLKVMAGHQRAMDELAAAPPAEQPKEPSP